MGTTNYICTHGMIWGEISDTGVTRSYGHDALGSVTETFVNGALENTYRYKPYGELLAKTGTAPDPSFLWNGGSGYKASSLSNSDCYVRARHFSVGSAHWTTVDTLWPNEQPFGYANANPITVPDPSGMSISYQLGNWVYMPQRDLNPCTRPWTYKCSGYYYWTLYPNPPMDGVIIQFESNWKANYSECSGLLKSHPLTPEDRYVVWFVISGHIYGRPTGGQYCVDYRSLPAAGDVRECSHGETSADLEARFFVGKTVTDLQYTAPNLSCFGSQGLGYTKTKPSFWDSPDSNSVKVHVSNSWNCCVRPFRPCGQLEKPTCNLG